MILCGFGESLYPLTEDDDQCKALLPICNRPMLSYPLAWVEEAGVQRVIVICHEEFQSQISAYVKSFSNLKISVEAPSSVDETAGTAEVIRDVRAKITTDFILLGCDFMCSIPATEMLNMHRRYDATLTSMLYESTSDIFKDSDSDVIGLSEDRSKLIYIKDMVDVDSEISVRMSLLWKYPQVSLFSSIHDAHAYICKHSVLELIDMEDFTYFKDDILPALVKSQTSTPVREKYAIRDPLVRTYMAKENDFVIRTDTLPTYMEANRYYAKLLAAEKRLPASSVLIKGSLGSTLTLDSALGEHSTVGERTFIKQTSVVGNNVTIGRNVRISSCVVMDHVNIANGVVLEGCIIGARAQIGQDSTLKNCEVAARIHVANETSARGEKFVESALLAEVEQM